MSTAEWHRHCRKAVAGSQTGKIHRLQELPPWHNPPPQGRGNPVRLHRRAGCSECRTRSGWPATEPWPSSTNPHLGNAAAPTRLGTPTPTRGTHGPGCKSRVPSARFVRVSAANWILAGRIVTGDALDGLSDRRRRGPSSTPARSGMATMPSWPVGNNRSLRTAGRRLLHGKGSPTREPDDP